MATLRYIPLNPVAHGFCDRPEYWRWSSYRATVTGQAPPFIDVDAVAGIFDDGIEGYRRFVEFGIEEAIERRSSLDQLLLRPDGILIAHERHGYSLRSIGRALGCHHKLVAAELERQRRVLQALGGWRR